MPRPDSLCGEQACARTKSIVTLYRGIREKHKIRQILSQYIFLIYAQCGFLWTPVYVGTVHVEFCIVSSLGSLGSGWWVE